MFSVNTDTKKIAASKVVTKMKYTYSLNVFNLTLVIIIIFSVKISNFSPNTRFVSLYCFALTLRACVFACRWCFKDFRVWWHERMSRNGFSHPGLNSKPLSGMARLTKKDNWWDLVVFTFSHSHIQHQCRGVTLLKSNMLKYYTTPQKVKLCHITFRAGVT